VASLQGVGNALNAAPAGSEPRSHRLPRKATTTRRGGPACFVI